jgi:hypothetical protein
MDTMTHSPLFRLVFSLALLTGLAACSSQPETQAATVTSTPAPATPTATSRPTATPAPTATVTPRPAQRYFTEEFDQPPDHWNFIQFFGDDQSQPPVVEDGNLVFDVNSAVTWLYALYAPYDYQDVSLEMSASNRGSDQNAVGLVCRYDQEQGWYEFNVSNDGRYSILYGEWLAEGISRYSPIVSGDASKLNSGSEANQYGFTCQGKVLTVFINGIQFRSIEENRFGLETGKVGVTVSSFQYLPVIVGVDWVKISQP